MTCPSCRENHPAAARLCPYCGTRVMKMEYGLIRTSAVLIAAGDCHSVYSSIHDVPEPLRKRLEASTSGKNAGTIVIADRRGKEEIERAVRFQRVSQAASRPATRALWTRVWPALVAMSIGAAGAWLAFLVRW